MDKLTQERLKELLDYNPDTGIFQWKIHRSQLAKVGDEAGYLGVKGYIRIRIDGKLYVAHRLAWLYLYGNFPMFLIDHINGIRNDNRISNLREATVQENARNKTITTRNKSGFKGVSWEKRRNIWVVRINTGDKYAHIGYFDNIEEAAKAYHDASVKYHGEFAYGV